MFVGFIKFVKKVLEEYRKESQDRNVELNQTFVEHRFHKQQKYVGELEDYAAKLEAKMYELMQENFELRQQLQDMTVAHSLDEVIEAFREEGKRANANADNNAFAALFGPMRKNSAADSNSSDCSGSVADTRLVPLDLISTQPVSDIIKEAHDSVPTPIAKDQTK